MERTERVSQFNSTHLGFLNSLERQEFRSEAFMKAAEKSTLNQ